MDGAAAFGAQLAGAKGHAGKCVKLTFFRIGKAGVCYVILNIGSRESVTAAHKTGKHTGRHAENTPPCHGIAQHRANKPDTMRLRVH